MKKENKISGNMDGVISREEFGVIKGLVELKKRRMFEHQEGQENWRGTI